MPISPSRTGVRAAAVAVLAGGLVWTLAVPASAHVEVSVQPAQAGARNALVTFDAEAESTTAGIAAVKIQLPAGLSTGMVSLAGGPAGWKLSTPGGVVTIAGAALPTGRNATYALRVTELPAVRTLAFKTIVAYADGTQDSWIELPTAGGPEPDNPAPVLQLAPADPADPAAPATPPTPTTATATPTTTPTATATPTTTPTTTTAPASTAASGAQPGTDDGGPGTGVWIALAVVVALVAGVGAFLARRSRAG